MLISSLYQLEIIYINTCQRQWYDLPFYVRKHPEVEGDPWNSEEYWVWMSTWRDIYYALIILSAILIFMAAWLWED